AYMSLIYYSHIPTALTALLLGIFILIKARNILASKVFFAISVVFAIWSAFDLILWTTSDGRGMMFFWALVSPTENLVACFTLYFAYVFLEKKDATLKMKFIFALLFIPYLFLTHTAYNLTHFDISVCEAKQGLLIYYWMFIEVLFFVLLISYLLKKIYQTQGKRKKQIILFSIGTILFLTSYSGANIFSSLMAFIYPNSLDNWLASIYSLFGMPIFMGFLAYLIVHYRAFRIRFMAVQALVFTLIILIASQFAFAQSLTNQILTGVTLLLALVFGLTLIESVKFEVRRKTEELALANSRLRKLDNAKSEFITIASHKLRTPMTAIKGFLSMLLEGAYGKLPDKHKDILNKVYLSNDRLITLAEDLLNVSKIESGKMEFVFEKADLQDIAQEVFDTFFIAAKEKNLTFTLTPPASPLPEVTTDRKKLREVLSDIVDNAIRYTPEGGVTISFSQDDAHINISIQDTGIGISEEEALSLFTKFSRGKDVSRLNTEGNGLSLHVTRSIMESLGGRITFHSEGKGKGTTFVVGVPMRGRRDKRG
ncbi:MAG: sensor histidine kinase, partial [Deltaproteobacteria bacterium]